MSVEEQKALAAPASISPAVEGEWRWIGSASVEFVPKAPLPFATRFTVTVPAGLKGVDGSTLKEAYSWSFDTPGPRLESATPAGNWRWLKPAQDIVLVFNQAVVEPEKSISLRVGPEGTAWPITVSAKPAAPAPEEVRRPGRDLVPSRRTEVTVKIGRPLPLATAAELVIAPTLRAKEGPRTLEQEVRLGYRTYGPARIEGVQACLGGYDCPYGPHRRREHQPARRRLAQGAPQGRSRRWRSTGTAPSPRSPTGTGRTPTPPSPAGSGPGRRTRSPSPRG